MKNKKILVVLGGTSGEREISKKSGLACKKALIKIGYKVSTFDPKIKSLNLINKEKTDIIFNALHGKDGEDGVAQSFFEYLKIPYTHSGVISSYNAMNKVISKEIFKNHNIRSPKFIVCEKKDFNKAILKNLIKKKGLSFPLVIKPINEGSSLGVKICKTNSTFYKSLKLLFKDYSELIKFLKSEKFFNSHFINKNKSNLIKTIFIQYQRNYFELPNKKLRLTMDENLKIFNNYPNRYLNSSDTIIELKYKLHDSKFVNNFINFHRLNNRNKKYSKYVNSFISFNNSGLI